MAGSETTGCLLCTGFLAFFLLVLLFSCSFCTLQPRQYGVYYRTFGKSIDRDYTVTAGRHLFGPTINLIKYPKQIVGYYFSNVGKGYDMAEKWKDWQDSVALSAWSADGQEIHIGIVLQMTLTPEGIPHVYMKYGNDPWSPLMVRLVAHIKNVLCEYTTVEFFEKRYVMKPRLEESLRAMLAADDPPMFNLQRADVRSIDLPAKFEETILTKILKYQAFEREKNKQAVSVTEAGVNEVRMRGEADALITLERARAEGDLLYTQTEAAAEKMLYAARADMQHNFASELGWVDDPELLKKALHFHSWQSMQARATASKLEPKLGVADAKLVAR